VVEGRGFFQRYCGVFLKPPARRRLSLRGEPRGARGLEGHGSGRVGAERGEECNRVGGSFTVLVCCFDAWDT